MLYNQLRRENVIYLHTVLLAAACVPVRAATSAQGAVLDLTHDVSGKESRQRACVVVADDISQLFVQLADDARCGGKLHGLARVHFKLPQSVRKPY